jgi:peroxiredoxin family protein
MATEVKMDRLSIVLYDGHFDKVHYGLAMAASAAAIDIPVTLFFTMNACKALTADWRDMPISPGQAAEPDETGGAMDARFTARKVATFEDLLSACQEMGVTFMVCEMGLVARDLVAGDLRQDITIEPGGLVSFLSMAGKHSNLVFI